jgi:hypothetical protein
VEETTEGTRRLRNRIIPNLTGKNSL